jgi:succinoglycan biosynthesis protein ExoO
MNAVSERGSGARAQKVMVVTNCLPGYDAGFAKSGHAQYLAGVLDHFRSRRFEIVIVLLQPTLDRAVLRAGDLPYRVVSPRLRTVGRFVVQSDPVRIVTSGAWQAYARAPRALQALGSALRTRVRKARGFEHVLGRFADAADRDFVRTAARAECPDIVLYDGLFNICGPLGNAQTWVLTHDVKHARARSFAELGVTVFPAAFSADVERSVLESVDGIIAIHWDDAAEFERMLPDKRVVVVPVALEAVSDSFARASRARCMFVGSGSYHNVDGIRWFLANCWPRIRAQVPDATLDIYGTVGYRLDALPAGAVAHGVVTDLGAAYREAAVTIVPLRIGSGLKVKLVEALAHGRPVVTTPVGAQGLASFAPAPFVTASTAAEFAAACIALLTSRARCDELAAAARVCAQHFTPARAFAQFEAATNVEGTARSRSGAARAGPMRACVAIPTFRRTELLTDVLAGVGAQEFAAERLDVTVLVLDNDPSASAADVVEAARAHCPFELRYEHVPAPGLASVRNRSLAFARQERFDYLAMIDDDERPHPRWLSELIAAADRFDAEVVVGPVLPVVPAGGPAWVGDLRARETPMHRDGELLRDGWSCNALVAVETLVQLGVGFDPALNFCGGEDQLFFRRLRAAGAHIVFASRAVVYEPIPPARWTLRFNLLRAYRRGNSLAYCERRLAAGPARALVRVAKALGLMGVAPARLVAALLDRRPPIDAVYGFASGAGMLAGLMGRMYEAYGRSEPHRA